MYICNLEFRLISLDFIDHCSGIHRSMNTMGPVQSERDLLCPRPIAVILR